MIILSEPFSIAMLQFLRVNPQFLGTKRSYSFPERFKMAIYISVLAHAASASISWKRIWSSTSSLLSIPSHDLKYKAYCIMMHHESCSLKLLCVRSFCEITYIYRGYKMTTTISTGVATIFLISTILKSWRPCNARSCPRFCQQQLPFPVLILYIGLV